MEISSYWYVFNVPVTPTNVVWFMISNLLSIAYISNYILQPNNCIGRFLKYFTEYGKFKSIQQKLDLPKSFFTHYYVLASVWNLLCFLTILGLCFGGLQYNWIAVCFSLHSSMEPQGDQISIIIVMIMITFHSMKRLYECLFVSVFSSKARINIIQYIWGYLYYIMLAPTLISECLPLNQLDFGSIELRHIIGIFGFAIASFIHHQSHIILADLRKKGGVKRESYGIPQGGVFTLVSCPHYFAEVLIYGFTMLIMTSQCKSWWLVLVYNIIIHANMAMGSHVWYRENFPTYPRHKKAFLPYLF